MSNDFAVVDIAGWEWDLHGIYSAYMGHFQSHGITWWDRSWSAFFTTFDAFLGFSWPSVIITDRSTGRGHIVTRTSSIQAFTRMIKTRFGEQMPNIMDSLISITPFETGKRHLRNINDLTTYKKLYGTIPAAVLSALKTRVRQGNLRDINKLWRTRDKTFVSINFECSEKSFVVLEWGYAAIRSAHLDGMNVWPPVPEDNYRKGHYIVQEYVDKVKNKFTPTYPWQYAWGESQVVTKTKLPEIIQSIIHSLASPDSESSANALVLVGHSPENDIEKFKELKVKIPSNVLVIDTATLERQLYLSKASRTGGPHTRDPSAVLSLSKLLRSLSVPMRAPLHNSGNDAFYTMLAFQLLVDPEGTIMPPPKAPKNDQYPMVASQSYPSDFNGVGIGRDYGTGGRHSRRMSTSTGMLMWEEGAKAMGLADGGGGRMSMNLANGSMPNFFPFPAAAMHVPSPLGGGFTGGHNHNGSLHTLHNQNGTGSGSGSPGYPIPPYNSNPPSHRPTSNHSNGPRERKPDRENDILAPPRAPFAREARSKSFTALDNKEKESQRRAQSQHSHSFSSLHDQHVRRQSDQQRPLSSDSSENSQQHQSSENRPSSSASHNPRPQNQHTSSSSLALARPGIKVTQHDTNSSVVTTNKPKSPKAISPNRTKSTDGFFSHAMKRLSMKP